VVVTPSSPRVVAKLCVLTVLVLLASLAAFTQPVVADQAVTCPDNFIWPVPASLVPQGAKKDKNGNGIVCAKYQDGQFVGGPDDFVDDINI
jgi:hypothetical protein